MSLLFPLYLLGAAAITLPILLHRRRQRPNERTEFGSLMFLEPTPPRIKTRSRLENILLLVLRCLAFLLLALCFTRPFLPSKENLTSNNQGRRTILLVDTSASMRREGLQESISQRASELLKTLDGRDRVAVISYGNEVRPLAEYTETAGLSREQRDELVMERLAGATPGWGGSRLDAALVAAVETIAEDEAHEGASTSQGGQIILLSDLQDGSVLEELNTFHWPETVTVVLEPIETKETSNAGILLAASNGSTLNTGNREMRVRIWNAADSKTEKFKLQWQGAEADGPELYVPTGKNRVVRAPDRPGPGASVLVLSGDQQDFDNRLHIAPELPRQLSIVYLGARTETGPQGSLFYLQKVFQPSRQFLPTVTAMKHLPEVKDFRAADVHLIIAESPIAENNLASIRRYLEGGRTLLHILNNEADLGSLQQLADVKGALRFPTNQNLPKPADYQLIEQLDSRHPVLSPFSDPRFRDFTKIHFWKHRQWPEAAFPKANILARFDNGKPVLVELPAGKGSILTLTSSWRPDDSQFAVSTKFVPLLFSILERSAGNLSRNTRFSTGDAVPLPQHPAPIAIVKPDGRRMLVNEGQQSFTGTEEPGIYRLETAEREIVFAVNLPPEESRTAPMDPDKLEQLGVAFPDSAGTSISKDSKKSQKPFAEIENRQKIWKWLLAAACVCFLLETWLAGRLTRSVAIGEGMKHA